MGNSEYRTLEDMYRVFFVDDHWYLFYRYHHILCERLGKIYKHAVQISEQSSVNIDDCSNREQPVAEATKLRKKCKLIYSLFLLLRYFNFKNQILIVPSDEYYQAFLDIVKNLLDGNMDSYQYEDKLRDMFGIHAYIAFTLDKVVHNCVFQLQYLVQDEVSSSVKHIYMDELRSNSLLNNSHFGATSCLQNALIGSQCGGCGGKVFNMTYSSVINSEMVYKKKVENLLKNQKLFRIISVSFLISYCISFYFLFKLLNF
jgi:hypothetical protein